MSRSSELSLRNAADNSGCSSMHKHLKEPFIVIAVQLRLGTEKVFGTIEGANSLAAICFADLRIIC